MRFISSERDTGKRIQLPDTRRDDCGPLDAAPRTPYAHSRGTAGITHAIDPFSWRCQNCQSFRFDARTQRLCRFVMRWLKLISQAVQFHRIERLIRRFFYWSARMARLVRSDGLILVARAPDNLAESLSRFDALQRFGELDAFLEGKS